MAEGIPVAAQIGIAIIEQQLAELKTYAQPWPETPRLVVAKIADALKLVDSCPYKQEVAQTGFCA